MEALWHNEVGPRGFYDFGQQIAVVPYVHPRLSTVIEHEMTHVSITNRSTLGLLQQVLGCLDLIGWRSQDPVIVEKAGYLSSAIMKHVVLAHESVAWFGTELNTSGAESVRAPKVYRDGVDRLRDAFAAIALHEADDSLFSYVNVVRVADALGACALSPPVATHVLDRPASLDPKTFAGQFAETANAPMARLMSLCMQIRQPEFQRLLKWAEWFENTGEKKDNPPALPAMQKRWWSKTDEPVNFGARPGWDSSKPVRLLEALCGGRVPAAIIEQSWTEHQMVRIFSHNIDRYAQCCLVGRPVLSRHADDEPQTAGTTLLRCPWLIVSSGDHVGFDATRPRHDRGLVISSGPDFNEAHSQLNLPQAEARSFLAHYADDGGGIVINSTDYDFSRGDFFDREVVEGIPHVVMSVTDLKSLWLRLAFVSQNGMVGTRQIEYRTVASHELPEEFGYLLFKGAGSRFPVVIVPMLMRNLDRALSVTRVMESPYGTTLVKSSEATERWAEACLRPLAAAIKAFSVNFEQPPSVREDLETAKAKTRWGLTARQKLELMSAR